MGSASTIAMEHVQSPDEKRDAFNEVRQVQGDRNILIIVTSSILIHDSDITTVGEVLLRQIRA